MIKVTPLESARRNGLPLTGGVLTGERTVRDCTYGGRVTSRKATADELAECRRRLDQISKQRKAEE